MRDIIQATICFALLLCVCAYGQARTVAGGGVASEEAPSNQWYSDDFAITGGSVLLTNHTGWNTYYESGENDLLTVNDGSDNVFGDFSGSADRFENNAGEYQSATGSVDQCVVLKAVSWEPGRSITVGGLFRGQAGDGTVYRLGLITASPAGDSDVRWSKYTISSGFISWDADIVTGTDVATYTANDYYGFCIKGTGGSNEDVFFWDFDTSEPAAAWDGVDGAGSNWGSATWKDTTTGAGENNVDTGNYVGVHVYTADFGSDADIIFDNWQGGDVND